MQSNKKFIIVSDVGSTNTKTVVLTYDNERFDLNSILRSATTVEKPLEDVRIGIHRSLSKASSGILHPNCTSGANLSFTDETCYITTSSAGGGLQILVIGLALNESASSAERAAYGAGGVILETISIDDGRSAVEQIEIIDRLRPDIILFSGGIDGGAFASVIRMAEILRVANPKPKFGVQSKIPLIFAGNSSAQDFIKSVLGHKFELHIVPNIRPTMTEENLSPARDIIHRLFMDNVMEQAPGYSALKELVSDPIIPTPFGVLKSLEMVSENLEKNILTVDIGGATTDIFSNLFGAHYRTVSANFGMSYSIANVMAEAGYGNIKRWLPQSFPDSFLRNYICNKMLYPTYIPDNDYEMAIEHFTAREAIRMSFEQHLKMNFSIKRIGFLDKMKSETKASCQFQEAMYQGLALRKEKFFLYDYDVIIGSGGVVNGSRDKRQIISLLNDSFPINGITEIWWDKDFISPQLGKLSDLDRDLAYKLLMEKGFKKIAIALRPSFKKSRKTIHVMDISTEDKEYKINSDSLVYIDITKETTIKIQYYNKSALHNAQNPSELTVDVPILVDTRRDKSHDFDLLNNRLNLYDLNEQLPDPFAGFEKFLEQKNIATEKSFLERHLPYSGEVYVKEGESVTPEHLLGEVIYDPPRLYIFNFCTSLDLQPDEVREYIEITEGQTIDSGQRLLHKPAKSIVGTPVSYYSPVRGQVEKIHFETGTVYAREIQDYPLKPITINVAAKIGIKPSNLLGHMKRKQGDFVRSGELLAQNMMGKSSNPDLKAEARFSSPTTGTITDVNKDTGTVTLQYLKKPFSLFAGVTGKVVAVEDSKIIRIEYSGTTIFGIIGFGRENHGILSYLEDPELLDSTKHKDRIVCCQQSVDLSFLKRCESIGVRGVIIPSLENLDLVKFTGQEIGIALTGNEEIPFPIIITEGFGNISLHPKIKALVEKYEGSDCYLESFTQIRAGVIRPKIIISTSS